MKKNASMDPRGCIICIGEVDGLLRKHDCLDWVPNYYINSITMDNNNNVYCYNQSKRCIEKILDNGKVRKLVEYYQLNNNTLSRGYGSYTYTNTVTHNKEECNHKYKQAL